MKRDYRLLMELRHVWINKDEYYYGEKVYIHITMASKFIFILLWRIFILLWRESFITSCLYDTNAGKVCKIELLQYLKDIKWLTCRAPVKASSFIIDKSFSSFDKSGFLTSKQKWQTIWTKMGSHYIYIRKHWNIFKSLTGTLAWMVFLEEIKQSTI